MTTFWILAAGLAGLAVLFVVAPLLQAPKQPTDDRSDTDDSDADQAQMNLALFKQQLAELDADLASGKLDQTGYESARRDLERELLNDLGDRDPLTTGAAGPDSTSLAGRLPGPRITALALLFVIPLSAWALYALIGNQSIIPELERIAAAGSGPAQRGSNSELPPLEELVARLEQRLEQQPDDAEGWMMLGRTYFATGNRKGAQEALEKAYKLNPEDPMIVLAYAESIATNNDNQLEGRPAELISEALELDPENTTARWLAAMVAFQRGQFRSAATTWQRLLEATDPSTEEAAELRSLIEEAEQRAGVPPEARQLAQADTQDSSAAAEASGNSDAEPTPEQRSEPTTAPETTTPGGGQAADPAAAERTAEAPSAEMGSASAGQPQAQEQEQGSTSAADSGGLQVRAELDPALAGRYPPNTTVFIFARAASGPPMPLAVQRTTLGQLPVAVQLDDSMAMMPAMQLSNFPQVIVGARVSPSGQAMPRPGDLEGESGPVSNASDETIRILIDRVRR
ncbi:c-type cytochrome biogenesis protein CcmI [Halochromatium glycolicum]|uniref:C-type cytochrome biogenesis protein CcmI n=1 Tax=Halochromatium glycolicum TaxID=85075 RepID=A0AAJ0U2C7_9GAMM|nr:c-type cytochrome biogenesis protein CcmI [Halochromatium glycolicum]MBK1704004.1 c-type cytochrome biogenesis protein CcmI [Halochromatium glycolicum]